MCTKFLEEHEHSKKKSVLLVLPEESLNISFAFIGRETIASNVIMTLPYLTTIFAAFHPTSVYYTRMSSNNCHNASCYFYFRQ